jgi:hypothetical protein
VTDYTHLSGVSVECVEEAKRAFDAQLARSLSERAQRMAAVVAAQREEDEDDRDTG